MRNELGSVQEVGGRRGMVANTGQAFTFFLGRSLPGAVREKPEVRS